MIIFKIEINKKSFIAKYFNEKLEKVIKISSKILIK